MSLSWIALQPLWYAQEMALLARHYPDLRVDEGRLHRGQLTLYGELVVRPPGGVKRYPIRLIYPDGAPYEHPYVVALAQLPTWKDDGSIAREPEAQMFDHRHQMPGGALCLFQRETRATPGGDTLSAIDVLRRAEKWFIGLSTGKWPPDTAQSELGSHFLPVLDALVEERFYDPALAGRGQVFFIGDYQRQSERRHGLPPLVLSALTEETTLVRTYDARESLSAIYPWIDAVAWAANKIASITDWANQKPTFTEHGYWWSLPAEPRPFHNGRGLLNALAPAANGGDAWPMVSSMLGISFSLDPMHLFGLKYPARDGGMEWLILVMFGGNTTREQGGLLVRAEAEKKLAFEQAEVHGVRVHRLQPAVLRLRNRGVVDDAVHGKTVALIGLGALGSEVAELLAKAGVGGFRLCDLDCLTTGNVARHVSGIRDFGAPKTLAVKRRLLEINPYLRFGADDVLDGSAVSSLDRLTAFMAPADLIISTTADESVEAVMNQVAIVNHKTVLYGRSLRRASMGRVFLVRPGRDACKACLADYATMGRTGRATPSDWVDVKEEDDGVLLHECGRPVIAGSAVDLSYIAATTARVALDFLEGQTGDENHWVWARSAVPDVDARLAKPMGTFAGQLSRFAGCPVCREPDVGMLLMIDDVQSAILTMAEASPEVETGGILIGFIDDKGKVVAVRATEPGPNAERTATRFRRDVPFTQAELDRAATELGSRGLYVGEWHSHLVADPQPSPIDIDSLVGVSSSVNYLTRCPVLVIVGLDPTTKKATGLWSWGFPLSGRMFDIPNRVIGRSEAAGLKERPVQPCP